MKRSILVTGATGFVGRQVLKALISRGHRIHLVVREGSGHIEDMNKITNITTTSDLFANDATWWAKVCANVDTIVHLAWYAEPGKYLTSPKNLDCLAGTLQLAKGAVQASVRRFVGVGTCFEYDLSSGDLSTETPLIPLTPYAGSKAAAFWALSQYLPEMSVEFAWCRLFYLFGEGEDQRRLVPYLRRKLELGKVADLSSGAQVRDFLDVRDAGHKVAEISLSGQTGAINVCSGIPITVRQLAERIADEYDRRDLLNFGARADNILDPPRVVGVPTVLRHD